jgi:DNA-binding FadR family transcriptional regulator
MNAHLSVYLSDRESDESIRAFVGLVEGPQVQTPGLKRSAPPPSIAPVERQRLYRQVADEIKRYILEHGLKRGDALPTEVEFAQQLGVSRPTVREALKGLQMVGVLTSRKGSGHAVGSLDLLELTRQLSFYVQAEGMDFRELAETRLFLEVNVLPLVAQRATEEDFGRLERAVNTLRQGLEERDQTACIAADIAFHRALFEASRNRLLANFADVIEAFFTHIRHALFTSDLDARKVQQERAILVSRALRDHRAICDAVRRKDVSRAREVMYDHLSVTCPPEVMVGGVRAFIGPNGETTSDRKTFKRSTRPLRKKMHRV